MDNIIQWNCKGLKNKYEEFKLFIQDYNPVAICLQESFILINDYFSIKGYTFYSYPANDVNGKANGGSIIMIRNDVAHYEVTLNSNLQAVAVTINLHKKITVCSLYLPPSLRLDIRELDDLWGQLPGPTLLLGDFNAHNGLWGCRQNNHKGDIIESFLDKNDLCLLNDYAPTYIHPATGSTSVIDLSLCHPSLFLDFSFKVGDDLCGSDHYPILLQTVDGLQEDGEHIPRFKLGRADWDKFQLLCTERIKPDFF